jgi:hypothetical protein
VVENTWLPPTSMVVENTWLPPLSLVVENTWLPPLSLMWRIPGCLPSPWFPGGGEHLVASPLHGGG